jgi:hypothetical protein
MSTVNLITSTTTCCNLATLLVSNILTLKWNVDKSGTLPQSEYILGPKTINVKQLCNTEKLSKHIIKILSDFKFRQVFA